jgi:Fe-S-cluster containining protein
MIKQFIPDGVCVKCKGCCRFAEADSIWTPCLLHEEVKFLAKDILSPFLIPSEKKIRLLATQDKDVFLCPFLQAHSNECKIYANRPFECQLYPFLINRRGEKFFLAVDLNCHFAGENLKNGPFEAYLCYLSGLFSSQEYMEILKSNPHLAHAYEQAFDLVEIKI